MIDIPPPLPARTSKGTARTNCSEPERLTPQVTAALSRRRVARAEQVLGALQIPGGCAAAPSGRPCRGGRAPSLAVWAPQEWPATAMRLRSRRPPRPGTEASRLSSPSSTRLRSSIRKRQIRGVRGSSAERPSVRESEWAAGGRHVRSCRGVSQALRPDPTSGRRTYAASLPVRWCCSGGGWPVLGEALFQSFAEVGGDLSGCRPADGRFGRTRSGIPVRWATS
jgi:hypothetical protein